MTGSGSEGRPGPGCSFSGEGGAVMESGRQADPGEPAIGEPAPPREEGPVPVCLQHFLYTVEAVVIGDLIVQTTSRRAVVFDERGVRGDFLTEGPGETVSFEGVANAFPVETFSRHTRLSHVRLKGEMDGEIALEIRHADGCGDRVIHAEGFRVRTGSWESPELPLKGRGGRFYLSCRFRGPGAIRNLGWWSETEAGPPPAFLVSITTYQSNDFVRKMIRGLCAYSPLRELTLSLLVVDNGGTFRKESLPDDPRLTLISQPNLGATGGCMRGLCRARATGADFLVTIADDNMFLHPEILYRLMVLQSLVTGPLAIGSMMLYLDAPTIVHEQGARVPAQTFDSMYSVNNRVDLRCPASFERLYRERSCDYSAWWLMSAPVARLSFTPAFFLYLDDILQGLLLGQDGVRTMVPPHLFIWQTFGNDMKSYRGYVWHRNELAMRLSSGLPLHGLSTIVRVFRRIVRCLATYDYARAELLLRSVEDIFRPAEWASDPLAGAELILRVRTSDPPATDLSGRLSGRYAPSKTRKRSRAVTLAQKLLAFVTVSGYLNPFAKSVASDGGLVFRYQGDNDTWQWTGYRQVAVIDEDKCGYLCRRSWKTMAGILGRTVRASFRLLVSEKNLRKDYRRPSHEYQRMWEKTFETIDRTPDRVTCAAPEPCREPALRGTNA